MKKLNRLRLGKLGGIVLEVERGIGNLRLGFPKSVHNQWREEGAPAVLVVALEDWSSSLGAKPPQYPLYSHWLPRRYL